FVARGTEPGAAKCAFGHACCLPGGQRSLRATLNTRTRFPRTTLPNRISPERSAVTRPGIRRRPRSGAHSGVPLAALDQDLTQRLDVVGHDPVRPQVQE